MKVLNLIIVAFGLAVCNGQSQDDIICVTNRLGFDAQACLTQLSTATDSPDERASFCDNGCARSVAEAYANCNFAEGVERILTICNVDEQGRFCEEVFTNETLNNLTNTCAADFDCTGGSCNAALQEFGCCGSFGGFDIIYSSCNVPPRCDPPFVIGTSPPPTDSPGLKLLSCFVNNQELQEQCPEYLPNIDFSPDATEPLTDIRGFFFGDNFTEFCASSCSERIAEVLNDCETQFGTLSSVIPEVGFPGIKYAEVLQRGCAKDNMNRVCFDLFTDDSYIVEIGQIIATNGPCGESLANGECAATCKDALQTLSCCTLTISEFTVDDDIPETRFLKSCGGIQPCPVPFTLDGSTGKASTIHGAVAVLMLISAIVSSLMI